MREPYWQSENGRFCIFHADCLEVMHEMELGSVDAVVTDPPYGMRWDGRLSHASPKHRGGTAPTRHHGVTIAGDDRPFDPTPWLGYARVVLFGMNHFAQRLPRGTTLVWIKRYDNGFGSFLSDAELVWMKGGCGVWCFRDVSLQGESRDKCHPVQKPLALMIWCLDKAKTPLDALVLDPFMGSGTTGVACVKTGRRFVGIEIEERYCAIAVRRIKQALAQPMLAFPGADGG